MGTLDGVGHGTALAGRYRLEEQLQSTPTFAVWRAVDQALDRAVGIRVIAGDTAAETLDAARRAAMVEDPRLLRVLDVGTHDRERGGALTYVVSELIHGVSLAELLAEGPLPADEVRALVGEAAQGLEHARASGLHHRRLGPMSVLRTPDGAVKVSGLAVDAAAEGADDVSSAQASREDAVSLVAVLYAGLTGRWPFGNLHGLAAAPHVSGQPAPPADVVAGVPNDLDTLCSVTFGPHDDGPADPGELAEQLAPWGPRRGTGAGRGATAVVPLAATGAAADDDTQAMRPPGRFPVRLSAGAPADPDVDADEDPKAPAGRDQSRIVLAVVAVLVVVGLALAINSLSDIGGDGPVAAPTETAVTPSEPAEPAEPTEQEEPTQTETPEAPPPAVVGVRPFDPAGDGENDDAAPRAIDDDPDSFWNSSTYTTADFGNLKDGLGMVVALNGPSQVAGVGITVNGSGGAVELRTSPDGGFDGSQVVAGAESGSGSVDFEPEESVETEYLLLWWTELPETDAGFRIELSQVQVQ